MKRFRVWMLLAALLMSVTTVQAMSPSTASLREMLAAAQAYNQTPCPFQPCAPAEAGCPDCPTACNATWFTQSVQQGVSAWRQLQTVCARTASACRQTEDCCSTCATAAPKACCKSSGCCTGAAACASPCCQKQPTACCTKAAACCEVTKAAPACCCAKACSCCETCKEKKTVTTPAQAACPLTACPGLRLMLSGGGHVPLCLPAPPAPVCVHEGAPQVIVLPMPGLPSPFQMVHKQIIPVHAPQAQQAHLVTPDLEAHCERMTHLGDMILLEGEVRLASHKNGQHIRIEAHRVLLNMKDGTFNVESELRSTRTSQPAACPTAIRGSVQGWMGPAPTCIAPTTEATWARPTQVIAVPTSETNIRRVLDR